MKNSLLDTASLALAADDETNILAPFQWIVTLQNKAFVLRFDESEPSGDAGKDSLYYKMLIREYTANDLNALRRLHALQGFGYPFPDLESPLFVTKLVLEEDDKDEATSIEGEQGSEIAPGEELSERDSPRIVMAVLLRLTAEAYLLRDPAAGTPRQRWQHLLALHEAARTAAASRGLDDVQAFLPPRIARAFGRRLARLGWRPDPWPSFTRTTA